VTAAAMTSELLREIPRRFPGCRVWRRHVQAGKIDGRFFHAGVPGEPDIEGIFPARRNGCIWGLWLGIEVKAAGDRLSEKQKNFRDMILKSGGIWLECREVSLCLEELSKYERILTP
jgi:hypothetical protein